MEKKLYDYEMDESLEIFLLIKSAVQRTTRNGKPFLTLTFQDTSGEMTGILWDVTEEQVETYKPSRVVSVRGKRQEYNGQPQLRIEGIRLANESEPNNPELYVKRAPINREKMIEQLNAVIFEITNPNMNRIVRFLLKKYQKEFLTAPAAKTNHHAFNGGLAFHTISMLEMAKTIVNYYPNMNRSLIYAGLILHDLGKVLELSGPTATEYTLEGQLIGHIVLVDQEITDACAELKIDPKSEDVLVLRHVILAHHGELEFGSPVRPQIKEAEVIHYLDQIDAKINMLDEALEQTDKGDFTGKIWAMENRRFYNPTFSDRHGEDE
jgi:3'-5' exoribonuclease